MSIYRHCLAEKITKRRFEKKTKIEYHLQLIHLNICVQISASVIHEIHLYDIYK